MNPRSIGRFLALILAGCAVDSPTAPRVFTVVGPRWVNQQRVPGSSHLRAVKFSTATQGIAMGDSSSIYKTDDGGATWVHEEHTPFDLGGNIVSFDFQGLDLVGVGSNPAGTAGRGWSSVDGINWAATDTVPAGAPFVSVDLVGDPVDSTAPNYGYFLRSDGMVRRRVGPAADERDSGLPGARSLDATSDGIVAVVGPGGAMRTSINFGATGTWSTVATGTTKLLRRVQILDTLTMFACGDDGTVCFTAAGGALAPLALAPATTEELNAIHFPLSAAAGWAVGTGGVIFKITGVDGGMGNWTFTWAPQVSGVIVALNDVYFLDDSIGYAVGDNGTVLKTTDGGANWSNPVTGGSTASRETLNAVDFTPDGVFGLAVGNNGTVLRTLNGGETWAAFSAGVPGGQTIRGVGICRLGLFNVAVICGDGGFVRRNRDVFGTGAWEAPGGPPPIVDYYAVVCWSGSSAIMVGNGTTLAYSITTSDPVAGNWVWRGPGINPGDVSYAGTASGFRSLCVTDDLFAFAGGTGGVLVRADLLTNLTSWSEILPGGVPNTVTVKAVDARLGSALHLVGDDEIARRVLLPSSAPTLQPGVVVPGATSTNGVAVFLNGVVEHAFVVGNGVWRSTDSGATWTPSPTHTSETLNGVWRRGISINLAYAVGTGGTILRTTVGGQ